MKRRVLAIVALLAIGGFVNVVVAWASAVLVDGLAAYTMHSGASSASEPRWEILVARGATSTVIQSGLLARRAGDRPTYKPPLRPDATPEEIDAWANDTIPPPALLPVEIPRWSRASRPPAGGDSASLFEDARGWPLRSLVAYYPKTPDAGTGPTTTCWCLPLAGQRPVGLPRALPLHPLPAGFAIDSLRYAAALLCLISPVMFVRWRRVRKARCVGCGYPLRGAPVCPECGRKS